MGTIVEILSQFNGGKGAAAFQIADEFNKKEWHGAASKWFRSGVRTQDIKPYLIILRNKGVIISQPKSAPHYVSGYTRPLLWKLAGR